ncbi:MAG: glutamine-hydrolyzing carbamoyl-phosphate synthase small subunit [Planctomycetota bacterium]
MQDAHADRAAGRLALANGAVFRGRAFGAVGRGIVQDAEVVFNTAITGYQECLTDPSYAGQILVLTAPLIGNTGVNRVDVESERVQIAGLVVRELARRPSSYRATGELSAYLAEAGVLGLDGVDTRALTRLVRTDGAMPGVMTDDAGLSDDALIERARGVPTMAGQNLVREVASIPTGAWGTREGEGAGLWIDRDPADGPIRVLAVDCGAKRNILRHLTARGCEVEIVPHGFDADEALRRYEAGEIAGLFVSNGPGDPSAVEGTIASLRRLVVAEAPPMPIFGICLGHQLLAIASGARSFKLPFGHRGANQPVRHEATGRVEITSQNHGFAVDPASLDPARAEATHVHLNDGTLAGFRLLDRPVFAVQYHPEASPGPHDSGYLFDAFVEACRASLASAAR